jgi:ABC-type lipoprotein release transport system permease subunit
MSSTSWIEHKAIFITLLLLFVAQSTVVSADIDGVVIDTSDAPVEASIRIIEGTREIAVFTTGGNGAFNIELLPGQYTVIVYADLLETPGADYVPAALEVDGGFEGVVVLTPGSTLRFSGNLQYIDTENLPLKKDYTVQDESGRVIAPNGFPLEFSDKKGSIYSIPELPIRDIIIPAESVVDVNVSSSILVDSNVITRWFLVDDIPALDIGSVTEVDIRRYAIPVSSSIAEDTLEQLERQIEEMDQYGFYLTKQEAVLSSGIRYLEDAEIFYANLDYDDSFDSLKRSYILLSHTNDELINMFRDAKFSVYLLIAFLAVASLVTGYLLFDSIVQQVSSGFGILCASLIFFYYAYPGSRTISVINFILFSLGSFLTFAGFGSVFPRIFRSGGFDGRVHTRNLITPIFNIAKRSLRRRRVRFMLTFISISLLVMSFVTLTSFSEGYGLISGESAPKMGWTGVYIREGNWRPLEQSFILVNDAEMNWILEQPEADFISPKAENTPSRNPVTTVQGQPIFGIIGVTDREESFVDIKETLIAGKLPEEYGVLISEALSESIGSGLDDTLSFGIGEFVVDGIFDDSSFRQLKDLDGTGYTSEKLVNINPEGEMPNYVIEDAEPDEVIILNLGSAVRFPTIGIQRIAIKINPSYNESGFAERLALERGYLSWSNTPEAYSSFRLGNYFQGKGATLIIPWIIVVLNVVVTMLNSLYERRKEIEILSAVGLNPAQVSSIFVAEAAITGFISGGLGYLIGLGFYKGLAVLNVGLLVHQKVSAVWSLASIGLAISAVITGAFAALKNSVVITPSLMRRWQIDRSIGGFQEPWRIDIPIKLEPAEVNNYLDFVESKLQDMTDDYLYVTSLIKRFERGDEKTIEFIYKSVQTSTGTLYTKNTLRVFPLEDGEYGAQLMSLGDSEWSHAVGTLIRRLSMDYSTVKV